VNLSATVFINRPARDVFGYVIDVRHDALWRSGVVEASFTSDGLPLFLESHETVLRKPAIDVEARPPAHMCRHRRSALHTVITTFPRACPSSKWRIALGASFNV
jgi:hypothetical protein